MKIDGDRLVLWLEGQIEWWKNEEIRTTHETVLLVNENIRWAYQKTINHIEEIENDRREEIG